MPGRVQQIRMQKRQRLSAAHAALGRMRTDLATVEKFDRGARESFHRRHGSDLELVKGAVEQLVTEAVEERRESKFEQDLGDIAKSATSEQDARERIARRTAEEQVKLIFKGGK